MHRLALSLLLIPLVAAVGVLTAAPAPFPKPEKSGPWITGWDKPIDPVGDCKFDRKDDKLTITVPGKEDRQKGPQLLRDVEGDFAAHVRINSRFPPAGNAGAYLIVTDGSSQVTVGRHARTGPNSQGPTISFQVSAHNRGRKILLIYSFPRNSRGAVLLRLERRGREITVAFSNEGANPIMKVITVELPRKLKVGVGVRSGSKETFQATFDQLKVTPVKPTK